MKTMSRLILGFVFIAAAAAPARAGASSDTLRPEVVETFFRLRVVAAALDSANVNGPVPGPTTGLIPFASVLDRSSVMAKLLRGSLRDA